MIALIGRPKKYAAFSAPSRLLRRYLRRAFYLFLSAFLLLFARLFFRLPAANHRLVGAYYGLVAANDGLVGANENNIRPMPAQMPPFALKISIERR